MVYKQSLLKYTEALPKTNAMIFFIKNKYLESLSLNVSNPAKNDDFFHNKSLLVYY